GFDVQDQTRLATAVSEIARNAFQYGGGGRIEFLAESGAKPALLVRIQDHGPGIKELGAILDGEYCSSTGMGVGIIGVRRLMDVFRIDSVRGVGSTVELGKVLPKHAAALNSQRLAQITDDLSRRDPKNPLDEVRQQNQELLRTLEELRERQVELARAHARL